MRPYTRDAVEDDLRDAFAHDDWQRAALLERQLDIIDTPTRQATLLGAALWYAEHGLPVFPLRPWAKDPWPGSRGLLDGTCDLDRIAAWWAKAPDSNVGLATGHRLDVIDFDGAEAHRVWSEQCGPAWADAGVDVLATVSTPRPGGLHVYVPAAGEGNRAGPPGSELAHVDYRGRGGYVVAPPSVLDDRPGQHPGSYRFLRPLRPEDLPPS